MDNRRLILFLVFSFSLIMLWEAWNNPQASAKPAATASAPGTAASAGKSEVPSPTPAGGPVAVPGTGAAVAPASAAASRMKIRTDLMAAEVSAQGGDLVHLELTKHHASDDKTRSFVLFDEKHAYVAQSGLIGPGLPNHKTVWRLPAGSAELKDGEDTLRVRLEADAEGGGKIAKTYVFRRGSYLVEVEYESAASLPAGSHAYFQLVRNGQQPEGYSSMAATFTGPALFTDAEKFQKIDFADLAKGKAKHAAKADNGWVAMIQHYFVSAWVPGEKAEREFFTRKLAEDLFAVGVIVPAEGKRLTASLYAGPQEQDKLAKIAPGLDLVVDYGWLTLIAAPLFWILQWLYNFAGNWGWAIILLTVLIKMAFFPLSAASYKSMAKMRVLTPKLMKLKETYADDRQRLNQEMMELYKKEKVNPLGGCLPILVQIPVFIALYWVLLGSVEMRQAHWLGWITDLSAKDPYYILPLIMGVTMFVQTKLNPTPPDPMQAKIMLWMPVIFTGMFLFFPAGLVLYWTVNNTLSIAQQWQINRMIEAGNSKPGH